jgi:TRAP transporter TAXI family solute receptor
VNHRVRAAAALIAALVCGAGCTPGGGADVPAGSLRIATGERGGVYHDYGEGLAAAAAAELPALHPTALTTEASVANLRLLDARDAEAAFTLADTASDAVEGTGPFTRRIDVVALARLYDNYVQLVVPRQSPIRSLTDLRGRRVATGAAGSGTDLVADRLLAVANLTQGPDLQQEVRSSNAGLEASARALRAGDLDAFFFFGGIPTPAVAELARATPIRVVPLGEWVPKLAGEFGGLYTEAVIPASPYRLAAPVPTVSVPNYLVVRRDMNAELAYRLTRLLFTRTAELARAHPEGRRLSVRTAISTYPLDLHPGAERWYRQARR